MKLTRRGFLGLSLATGVLAGGGLWLRRFIRPAPLTSSEVKTLESYLDTLIPADDSSGAVELGVTDSLIQKAAVNKRYKKLIQKGCKWLDSEAQRQEGADFAALTEPQREGVMRVADDGTGGLLAKIFFEQTREDAFFYYYGHPKSWRALGYAGPPQPRGFLNYTQPPTGRAHG